MAWENRNGRDYYYRKQRVGRRVVSEYIGAGILAELTAEQDQAAQAEREAQQQKRAQVQALDSQLAQVDELTRALVRASLLLAGYHPHKRQWRRRNG